MLTFVLAVILVNVRGFYEPLRLLIQKGVEEGFILPVNETIIVFVDGPSSFDEHDNFDWGTATLQALDAWKWDRVQPLFKWSTDGAPENEKLKAT